jgi:hypothetical protein
MASNMILIVIGSTNRRDSSHTTGRAESTFLNRGTRSYSMAVAVPARSGQVVRPLAPRQRASGCGAWALTSRGLNDRQLQAVSCQEDLQGEDGDQGEEIRQQQRPAAQGLPRSGSAIRSSPSRASRVIRRSAVRSGRNISPQVNGGTHRLRRRRSTERSKLKSFRNGLPRHKCRTWASKRARASSDKLRPTASASSRDSFASAGRAAARRGGRGGQARPGCWARGRGQPSISAGRGTATGAGP